MEGFARVAWAQAALDEAGVPTSAQVQGAVGADAAAHTAAVLADGGYTVEDSEPSDGPGVVSYHAVDESALALAHQHTTGRCVWNVSTDTRSVSGFGTLDAAVDAVDVDGDVCDAQHAVDVVDAATTDGISGGGATGDTTAGGEETGAASGVAASGPSTGTGDGGGAAASGDAAMPGFPPYYDANSVNVTWDVFDGHSRNVEGVAVSPDGDTVYSGSRDDTVDAVDAATGEEDRQFTGHDDSVYDVAVSPDGDTVYSASSDDTVRAVDADSGDEQWKFTGHSDRVRAVAVSPDGEAVYSGSRDSTVRAIDAETGAEQWQFTGHSTTVRAVAVSPDDDTVYSGSRDGTVRAVDAATGDPASQHTQGD